MRQSTVIKIVLGLTAVALFAFLFIRSARSVGAQPYTMGRASLGGWKVGLDPAPDASGVVLALWPPSTLAPPLFSQIFSRSRPIVYGCAPTLRAERMKRKANKTTAVSPRTILMTVD